MATSTKTILAISGAALLLGACASDPYYNGYHGDRYSYGYDAGPAYYDPYYYGPSVGFGLAGSDGDGRWHRDHDRDRGRDRDRDRDGDGDRGGHEGRDGSGSTGQNERG